MALVRATEGAAECLRALSAFLHVPDPRPERDALIAATAAVHDLTVATRNVEDFEALGVAIVNRGTRDVGLAHREQTSRRWRIVMTRTATRSSWIS